MSPKIVKSPEQAYNERVLVESLFPENVESFNGPNAKLGTS